MLESILEVLKEKTVQAFPEEHDVYPNQPYE
jgi:hypothetical protein